MSYKREWWDGLVRKAIWNYEELSNDNSDQARKFRKAIDAALEDMKKRKDGAEICKAVELVYFKHTHQVAGAGMKIGASKRTTGRMLKRFVNCVADHAGF